MVSVNKGSWDKLSENGSSVEENISLTENGLNYVKGIKAGWYNMDIWNVA